MWLVKLTLTVIDEVDTDGLVTAAMWLTKLTLTVVLQQRCD